MPCDAQTLSATNKYNLPASSILCEKCDGPDNVVSLELLPQISPHCAQVSCQCLERWYLCLSHKRRYSRLDSLRRHMKSAFHPDIPPVKDSSFTDCDTDFVTAATYEFKEGMNVAPVSYDQSPSLSASVMPERSKYYFKREMEEPGSGMQHIVRNAFSSDQYSCSALPTKLETLYHDKVWRFLRGLTQDKQREYADIMAIVVKALLDPYVCCENPFPVKEDSDVLPCKRKSPSSEDQTPFLTCTHVVTCFRDINRIYLTGKNSIEQNYPKPSVKENDSHSYSSLRDVIEHILAHGLKTDDIKLNKSADGIISEPGCYLLSSTPIAETIRTKVQETLKSTEMNHIDPMVLHLCVWSDDFEVNKVKQNRKSVWCLTVTVSPPKDKKTSTAYTYCIALGRKGQDHENVLRDFWKEVHDLKKVHFFYHGTKKRNIPVLVELLSVMADTPEKAVLTKILNFKGNSSKRFMYSAYLDNSFLPSCKECFESRAQATCSIEPGLVHLDQCKLCGNWNYAKLKLKPFPKGWPTTKHEDSPPAPPGRDINRPDCQVGGLPAVLMSFEYLMMGSLFLFFNVYHGFWNIGTAKSYLGGLSLNDDYGRSSLIDVAKELARTMPGMTLDQMKNRIVFPGLWSNARLEQVVSVPMHQLFSGITKSVVELIADWLKTVGTGSHKKFGDTVVDLMVDYYGLQLDWCRVEPFSGRDKRSYGLGGWQAENFVAMVRILTTLYSRIPVASSSKGFKEAKQLLIVTRALISRLMTLVDVSLDEIDNHVKLFLSCADMFEKSFCKVSEPCWATKPNFLALLNLREQIWKFGKLRLYWEGDRERYVQYVKPLMKSMRNSVDYLVGKHKDLHLNTAADLSSLKDDSLKESASKNRRRHMGVHCYKNKEEVMHNFIDHKPLSGILSKSMRNDVETELNLVAYRDGRNKIKFMECVFLDREGCDIWGTWNAPTSLVDYQGDLDFWEDDVRSLITSNFAFDLMILSPANKEEGYFYHVQTCDNWLERTSDGSYTLPTIPQGLLAFSA